MTTTETGSTELLPCPFCGSADINTEGPCYDAFMCNACGVSQYDQPGHSEAIVAWNTRPLRNAQSEAVAYWAVHSVTGAHIGLWEDETYARNVLKEYAGGTITPLYTHPAPPLAVTDEMVEALWRGLLSCPHTIEGHQIVIRSTDSLPGNAAAQTFERLRNSLTAALEAKQ